MIRPLPRSSRMVVWLATIHFIAIALTCIRGTRSPGEDPGSRSRAVSSENSAWSRWRGPLGKSVAENAQLPSAWSVKDLKLKWSYPLETGWSSPVVTGDRVYFLDRFGNQERTHAVDIQTGKPVWVVDHPVDFDPHAVGRGHGNGPKSTPIIADGRVYALGIAGWLECLSADSGESIWRVNLPEQFGRHAPLPKGKAFVDGTEAVIVPIGNGEGAAVPLFGYTGSPYLSGEKLILSVGGERGGTVIAFHKDTGKVIWKSLDEDVSYSSPVVTAINGVEQVVVMTGPRVVGLDVSTGDLLWSHPFQVQYDESVGTPVIVEDLVIVNGDGHPLTALRIGRSGQEWSADTAWENRDLSSYLSSMVARDGHLYGMSDSGQVHCVEIATGNTAWSGGDHGFYCCPVLVGDRLLGLNEKGSLAVFHAVPEGFTPGDTKRVTTASTWSVPAVDQGRIFIRAEDAGLCFEVSR